MENKELNCRCCGKPALKIRIQKIKREKYTQENRFYSSIHVSDYGNNYESCFPWIPIHKSCLEKHWTDHSKNRNKEKCKEF